MFLINDTSCDEKATNSNVLSFVFVKIMLKMCEIANNQKKLDFYKYLYILEVKLG